MSPRNIDSILPLTPVQQGILYHSLEAAKPGVYLGQFTCRLHGHVDPDDFRRAWEQTVARHAALRTLFTWEGREKPLQIVRQHVELPFEYADFSELGESAAEQRWQERCETSASREFDLTVAPLVRLSLVRLAEDRYAFLFGFHHLIVDGWSTRKLVDEALRAYASLQDGATADTTPAPPFGLFVEWLAKQDHGPGLALFRDMLAGFSAPTFPSLRHAAGEPASGTRMLSRRLAAASTAGLVDAARRARLTLNTLVVAAWAEVLQRYCDADDVVFGTTMAGRPPDLDGIGEIAGLFINTLPVRIRERAGQPVSQWLRDIQAQQTRARDVQQTPLVDVLRECAAGRSTPLFESIVVFENLPDAASDRPGPAVVDAQYREFSHYPLAILVVPGSELELHAVIDRRRLSEPSARQLLEHLETVLVGIGRTLADDGSDDIEMLTAAERQRLIVEHNATAAAFDRSQPVHRYFEDVAARSADVPAVVDGREALSYASLDERANRLANILLGKGVGRGAFVPIVMGRSCDAIAAMLAVLKTGAAYAPIDPRLPKARIATQLVDLVRANEASRSGTVAICDHALPAPGGVEIFRVDREGSGIAAAAGELPAVSPEPGDPAYVMYTSGSSGDPKGVVVAHRNLANSTLARPQHYGDGLRAFLLLSSIATDSSVAGIYWSLLTGATLVLPGQRQEQDVHDIGALIGGHGVTHLLAVPSLYTVMLEHCAVEDLARLQAVIVAGESCPQSLVDSHYATCPAVDLYNEYGPTEATVWATYAHLRPAEPVSIGQPIANAQVYVLDSQQRPVPERVGGELFIGGEGVATGYLNDADKTARRFVPNRLTDDEKQRLYRTGDRVAWRPDGNLEFLGRVDNQIKVRGYRVEPEEIEAVLSRHDGIEAAAVFLDESNRLTACVQSRTVPADAVRDYAQRQLPEFMVPQRVAIVEQIPVTPAGKIDRAAVRAGDRSSAMAAAEPTAATDALVAPRNATEEALAAAWSKVLGIDELSVHDDFFEVGGDSLLSIRILAQLGSAGVRIGPEDFFAHPTIAGQAAVATFAGEARPREKAELGAVPLSPIQHWFANRIHGSDGQWNQCRLYLLAQPLSESRLREIVNTLVAQHDALRLHFKQDGTALQQFLGDADADSAVSRIATGALTGEALQLEIEAIARRANRDMAVDAAPLVRFVLLDSECGEDRLLIVGHHLVIDALSFGFLEEDVESAFRSALEDQAPALPDRTANFTDWCRRLAGDATTLLGQDAIDFWLAAADSADCELPVDLRDGANDEGSRCIHTFKLSPDRTRELLGGLSSAYRIRVRELLLAGLCRTLTRWTGRSVITVDIEGHGRESIFDDLDNSRTLGWLTSVFPVNLVRPDNDDSNVLLTVTKETLRQLPMNGMSFGILKDLGDGRAAERLRSSAPAQFCFNYLTGGSQAAAADSLLALERENIGECRNPKSSRAYLVELNIDIRESCLTMHWHYSRNRHRQETIEALARDYAALLGELLDHCLDGGSDGASPSDFPLAGLDKEGLAEIADLLGTDGADS